MTDAQHGKLPLADSPRRPVVMAVGREFAFLLLMALAASFAAARLFNLAGSTNLLWPAVIGSATALGLSLWLADRQVFRAPVKVLLSLLIWLGLLAPLVLLLKGLPDFSYDANTYHIPGIMAYKDGWNPFVAAPDAILWTQVYPNGLWQLQAMIEHVTGTLGMGRMTGPILYLCAIFALYDLLRLRFGRVSALQACGLLLVVCNPYIMLQWHVHYVDGEYTSLALIYGCSLAIMLLQQSRRAALMLGASLLLAVNTKVSGVYILFFLTAALLIGLSALPLIRLIRRKAWKAALTSRHAVVPAAVLLGLLLSAGVFGYRPYVTNAIDHGTPFYHGNQDFTVFSPPNLKGASRSELLAHLAFARVNPSRLEDSVLKLPGSTGGTGDAFLNHETAQGGYGHMFSLLLLLSLVLAGYGLRDSLKARKPDPFLLMGVAALVATILFPYPIQARFVPWGWIVPGMLFLSGSANMRFALKSPRSFVGILMSLILVIHLLTMLISMLALVAGVKAARVQLLGMLESQDTIWRMENPDYTYGPERTWQLYLAREGIEFAAEPLTECGAHQPLKLSGIERPTLCLSPGKIMP